MSSPSPTHFPPATSTSSVLRLWSGRTGGTLLKDRHGALVSVHADSLAGSDGGRPESGADHGGEPVLPGHDRGVAHDPADVRYRGPDAAKDRGPARRSDGGDQDLALLQPVEVVHAEYDP